MRRGSPGMWRRPIGRCGSAGVSIESPYHRLDSAYTLLGRVALKHWLQLALTEGIGPILSRRLIDATGGAEAACAASARVLATIEGIGARKSDAIHRSLREADALVEAELARAATLGVSILSPDDERYPVLLQSIPDPPAVLYVRGVLEARDL